MAEIKDQMDRAVEVPSKPQRIVSLVPSITELIFDLGLDEEVVGVTKFCIHPGEKVFDRKKIGGTKKLNLDDIRELKPDLIIGNKEENVQEQIDELAGDFPVWMSDVNSLEDALRLIESVGEIIGKKRASEIMTKRILGEFEKLELHLPKEPRTTAYLIWREPYMVAGNNTFVNSILSQTGFENVFGDQDRYPEVTADDLIKADPDLILLSSEPFPFKDEHFAEFREICPNSTVLLVSGEKMSWYGSQLLKTPSYLIAFWRSLNLLGIGRKS